MGAACWLIASLRYVTGFDYRFYEAAFQEIAVSGLSGASWSEPGYLLLNWAVALLGGDYRVFLFAASQGFHGVYPYHGIWDRAMAF